MNGKLSERTTPLMISAMRSTCSSLSITQGPAMRNRSPEPTRTLSIWKDKVKTIYRRDAESAEPGLSSRAKRGIRSSSQNADRRLAHYTISLLHHSHEPLDRR